MGDYFEEEKWWRGAFHEAGHTVALVSMGIVPTHVDVSIRGGGYTAVECLPAEWTETQDDTVTLAGIVAEHIYRDDFDVFCRAVRRGAVTLSGDDGKRVHEQDCRVVAKHMERLKDFIQNRRWSLVEEIAGELMEHGAIDNNDIEAIYQEVFGAEEIGRIASRAMRQSLKNEIRWELSRRLKKRR